MSLPYVMPTDEPVTHVQEMSYEDARDLYAGMLSGAAMLADGDSEDARRMLDTFGPHATLAEARAWHLRELDCDRKTFALAFAKRTGERIPAGTPDPRD